MQAKFILLTHSSTFTNDYDDGDDDDSMGGNHSVGHIIAIKGGRVDYLN